MTRPKARCCQQVIPTNSARLFKNPAPILKMPRVKEILNSLKRSRILEVGAGCLRNALYFQSLGHKVFVLEANGMEERFNEQYRVFRRKGGKVLRALPHKPLFRISVATFVAETICDPMQREALFNSVRRSLHSNGCLIMSVRGPRDLLTAYGSGKRCSDGFLTPNRTFSRAYSRKQLQDFLNRCGFRKLDFLHKPGSKAPELLHVIAWR
jgi:hypothetical protein